MELDIYDIIYQDDDGNFYTYKGNLFLEYSLFIILCFVYITQFSMEAINNLKINSRKESSENVINFETIGPKTT